MHQLHIYHTIETNGITEADSNKHCDAFLYYSNDEIRMSALKLKDTNTKVTSTKIGSNEHIRKTRPSFELDPLLIMEDFIHDLLDKDHAIVVDCDELQVWV